MDTENKVDVASKRKEILEQAIFCTCNDRNAQYAEPEVSLQEIAKGWSRYLGVEISPHDAAVMMTIFKLARIKTGGVKDDNYIDGCGYLACAAEIAASEGEV